MHNLILTKKNIVIFGLLLLLLFLGIVLASKMMIRNRGNANRQFSTSIVGLPSVKPTETVMVNNGDSYTMTASMVKKTLNGKDQKMLAYNGQIPGPILKVKQGSEITLNLINDTDVDTALHSHGVRVDSQFDGAPPLTIDTIRPGQSFTYKLRFPDAGVYWYHPHIRPDYAQELGLYGNFIVEPNDANYWSIVNREEAVIVDDIALLDGFIPPFSTTIIDHTLMGRFGNTMLVNGQTDYALSAKQGEVIRFYITNAANTRTFQLRIPNVKMKLVGGDNGRYHAETFVDSVLLSPSERAIVEVLFEAPGMYRLEHKTDQNIYALGSILVSNSKTEKSYSTAFDTLRTTSEMYTAVPNIEQYYTKKPDKNLTLSLSTRGLDNMTSGGGMHAMENGHMMHDMDMGTMMTTENAKIEWEDIMAMMNAQSTTQNVTWKLIDQDTGKENQDINWQFNRGDLVKMKIYNDPKSMHQMQHPIHFHGQRFLILSTNGQRNDNLVWKDTTLVQNGDTVELLVAMDNPGKWMAHCHIVEHLESGMMLMYEVN